MLAPARPVQLATLLMACAVISTGVASGQQVTTTSSPARASDLASQGWRWGLWAETPEFEGELMSLEPQAQERGFWDRLTVSGAAGQQPKPYDAETPHWEFTQPWQTPQENSGPARFGVSKQTGLGLVTLEGGSGEEGSQFAITNSYSGQSGWLRGAEARVEANESQTLFAAGGIISLYETCHSAYSARLLGGYTRNNRVEDDEFHFTADVYGGWELGEIAGGCHLLKAGGFVDQQGDFGKAGPELAMMLYADHLHPLTVDFAYGFGYGSQTATNNVAFAADEDLQLRVGTFLGQMQVGGIIEKQRFVSGVTRDDAWGGGGFVRFPFRGTSVSLNASSGEQGLSGFASVVYQPGTGSGDPVIRNISSAGSVRPPLRQINDAQFAGGPHPWLSSPIMRSVGIRSRTKNLFGLTVQSSTLDIFGDSAPPGLSDNDDRRATWTLFNPTAAPITVTIQVDAWNGTFDPPFNRTIAPGATSFILSLPSLSPPSRVARMRVSQGGQTSTVVSTFQTGQPNGDPAVSISIQ